MNEVSKLKIGG